MTGGITLWLQYKYGGRVTMELVDTESDTTDDEQLVTQYRMSAYVEQFTDPDISSCEELGDKPVFLSRYLSYWNISDSYRQIRLNLAVTNALNIFWISQQWTAEF